MFLFCLVFAMFCARLFICALWSPAGKGLTSWLSFVVSSVSLSLSHWYPGSGVVLDCIDSWSLHHYLLLMFFIIKNLWLYSKIIFLISDVDVYPLHAHDIKFNVDPLTPNQITFCLADTKKSKFQDPHTCWLHLIKWFMFIQSGTLY